MLIHSSLLELYEISIFAGPKWLNICTFTWLNSKCTQNVQCFYVSSHLTLTALRGSRHSSEENEARRGKTHCQHLLPLLPTCLRGISQTRASHCQKLTRTGELTLPRQPSTNRALELVGSCSSLLSEVGEMAGDEAEACV